MNEEAPHTQHLTGERGIKHQYWGEKPLQALHQARGMRDLTPDYQRNWHSSGERNKGIRFISHSIILIPNNKYSLKSHEFYNTTTGAKIGNNGVTQKCNSNSVKAFSGIMSL